MSEVNMISLTEESMKKVENLNPDYKIADISLADWGQIVNFRRSVNNFRIKDSWS